MFPNFGLFSQVQNMSNVTEFSAKGRINSQYPIQQR
jgi:hypothetical protein